MVYTMSANSNKCNYPGSILSFLSVLFCLSRYLVCHQNTKITSKQHIWEVGIGEFLLGISFFVSFSHPNNWIAHFVFNVSFVLTVFAAQHAWQTMLWPLWITLRWKNCFEACSISGNIELQSYTSHKLKNQKHIAITDEPWGPRGSGARIISLFLLIQPCSLLVMIQFMLVICSICSFLMVVYIFL